VAVWIDLTNPRQTLADQHLDAAFAAVLKQRAEALFVHALPIELRDGQRIAQFAIRNWLPTMALFPQFVREGMLMSYGPNLLKGTVAREPTSTRSSREPIPATCPSSGRRSSSWSSTS
jgi:hypothetical protein